MRRQARARAGWVCAALCAAAWCRADGVLAQARTRGFEPERLPALGRSVAGTDDTTAVVANPANLAFLPGPELRWQSTYLSEARQAPWQGHAISLGFPLFFSLATALRVDLISPPAAARVTGPPANYQWLTWGLALGLSRGASLGLSLQRSYSSAAVTDGIGTFSAGLSLRPWRLLGLSGVVRNAGAGVPVSRLRALGYTDLSVGSTLVGALALRPLGTGALELGLEGAYMNAVDLWVPRATLGIALPHLGRLRTEVSGVHLGKSDAAWMASVALAVDLNFPTGSVEYEGGGLSGSRMGDATGLDYHAAVATRIFREPTGVTFEARPLQVRLEDTPNERGHVALLRRLWALAETDEVRSVVFEVRASPAESLARVEELRDAVQELRRRGKRTACHLEDATGAALYFCTATDRVLLNPAGSVRFAGMRTQHLYYRGLLDQLGVRADFVRIGPHKSAPESYTRTGATPEARADTIDLLQQHERQFMQDLGADRQIAVDELRRRIARGPFTATEARAAGLVDALAQEDELDELMGTRLEEDHLVDQAPSGFGPHGRVAVVHIAGDMVDGRSKTIPFIGMSMVGSYTIAETLQQVRKDRSIDAVVLRVDSPGGSSMAAEVIGREVALTAKVKPTVVSMGAYAASGGYYIAAPATRIFANPLTITGSIGVFYGKADLSGLLRKLGVNVEVYKTAPHADAESMFRPFTPAEREELARKIEHYYDIFVSRVAEGRKMKKEAVDAVGRGRVWTGEQAHARGLVDELGGLRQALAYARRAAGLADDAEVIELPVIETSLVGRLLGLEGVSATATAPPAMLPPQVRDLARSLAPFLVYRPDQAMMRLELTADQP